MMMILLAACGKPGSAAKPDAPGAPADAVDAISVDGLSVDAVSVDALSIDAPPDALPSPLDFDGAHSGTRIKLQWWVYADGAKQWFDNGPFHDAVLATDCQPGHLDSDTRQLCMPTSMLTVNYSDSTCQTPIVVQNMSPYSQYVALYPYTPSGPAPATYGATHIYQLGTAATGNFVYYKDSNGTCQGWGSYAGSNFYSIGAEVTSQLVEMTPSAPTSGALGVRYLETADGFSYPQSLHDATNGYDCLPLYTWATVPGGTSTVCAPTGVSSVALYSDSTCVQGDTYVNAGAAVPTYVGVPPRSSCPTDPASFFAIGSAVSPPAESWWDPMSQSCKPTSMSGGTYYRLGSSVSTLPLARGLGAATSQRIQRIHYTDGATTYPEFAIGYDTVMHAECDPTYQPDGTFRCLPFTYGISSYFRDATCTMAIQLAENDQTLPSTCTPLAPFGFARTSDVSGDHLYSVGSKYTGTVYFLNGANCQVYPSPKEHYLVGAEIPLSSFANATLQVDP